MDYAEAAPAQYQSDGLALFLFVNWVWNAIWGFFKLFGLYAWLHWMNWWMGRSQMSLLGRPILDLWSRYKYKEAWKVYIKYIGQLQLNAVSKYCNEDRIYWILTNFIPNISTLNSSHLKVNYEKLCKGCTILKNI